MTTALKEHWPEYLMEAALLGLFMISACVFTVVLDHPASPVRQAISDAFGRRLLTGLAMGSTAVALIYSPWGKQSGAHFNPSVTLAFWRLGKVKGWDATFYVLAQFVGGAAGVLLATLALREWIGDPAVNYAATVPGNYGVTAAFAAEVAISFALMSVVLRVSSSPAAALTGIFAGALVATFIAFEAPISGMSMNPARTLGSAFSANTWTALWLYFTAPPIGMLAAAELHSRMRGGRTVGCAKLHHQNSKRCIFCGAGM